ncbi:TPA: hypothetical protein ACH3X3_012273 [Trebouxia sp. C0006]
MPNHKSLERCSYWSQKQEKDAPSMVLTPLSGAKHRILFLTPKKIPQKKYPLSGSEVGMFTSSLYALRCRQGQGRGTGDVQSLAGGVQGGGQHVSDGQDAPLLQSWRAGPPGRHLGPYPKVHFTSLSSDLLMYHVQYIMCAASYAVLAQRKFMYMED